MAVIITSVIVASICGMLSDAMYGKIRLISDSMFMLSALALLLPLALRGMGVDYQNYEITYNSIAFQDPLKFWSQYQWHPEPLYAVLNFMARWIFGSFQGVNVLCATLAILPTFWTIGQFRDKASIGVTTFALGFTYYIQFYGLNRMMIAVALASCAYVSYAQSKPLRYLLLVAVASLFHYSAILMAPMYLVLRWIESRAYLEAFRSLRSIIGVVLVFFAIVYIFPKIAGSFTWYTRYVGYFDTTVNLSAINNSAPFFPVLLCVVAYSGHLSRYLGNRKALVTLILVLTILTVLGAVFPMHRLCYFFFPAGALLYGVIPKALADSDEEINNRKILSALFVIAVILYGAIWFARPYVIGDTLWLPHIDPYVLGSF